MMMGSMATETSPILRSQALESYGKPVNDLQELARTHYQALLRKVQVQHSIMTHTSRCISRRPKATTLTPVRSG